MIDSDYILESIFSQYNKKKVLRLVVYLFEGIKLT